jgi:hypothetical protein
MNKISLSTLNRHIGHQLLEVCIMKLKKIIYLDTSSEREEIL